MATATSYDEWDDAGLAFTEALCQEYRPQKWAEEHVAQLAASIRILKRKVDLPDIEKPEWWKKALSVMERNASWYCVAMEIPALEAEDAAAPGPQTKAGKAITMAAQALEPRDFLTDLQASAEANMRYVVSIGRRCMGNRTVSGWVKMDGKFSNKLANCVMKEITSCAHLEKQLDSRKKSKAEKDGEDDG